MGIDSIRNKNFSLFCIFSYLFIFFVLLDYWLFLTMCIVYSGLKAWNFRQPAASNCFIVSDNSCIVVNLTYELWALSNFIDFAIFQMYLWFQSRENFIEMNFLTQYSIREDSVKDETNLHIWLWPIQHTKRSIFRLEHINY